ncbi:MAG: amidohydrolase family protein [Gemmatimonadales bacterium]
MRAGALTLLLALAAAPAGAQTGRFDLVIRGARILDGTGNPAFPADVGIRDGRIARVGDLSRAGAGRTVDATGLILAPGFIDLHSHADDGASARGGFRDPDPKRRAAPNLVSQGVTTVVVNQDGRSPWPIAEQRRLLEQHGIGPNAILLVGHGTVRGRALGRDPRRPATGEEIAAMRRMVHQAMEEGAWGLSAGLEYVPGRWSTTDEVVALAEEIVPYRGVYVSHERSEGADPMWYWPSQDPPGPPTLLDAVRETIEIGERSGATVVASHIKAKGSQYWGSSGAAIRLIERARARGVDVWADQYPYATSGSDGGTVLIPRWVWREPAAPGTGGSDLGSLRTVLADSGKRAALERDIRHEIERRGGADKVVVFEHPDPSTIGRSLAEVGRAWRLDPVATAVALQLRGDSTRPGGGRLRGFSMDEVDIESYAARPWVATASDAGIALPEDGPDVHARYYGTFPRKIRRYALERGVLELPDAIRSMTSLPAQILGLRDRGLVREGLVADLVLFDPERITDRATFEAPHQHADGITLVLVGGEPVVDGGELTWRLPGAVLLRDR